MSFDDYAQHLAQKYRLALSIAILNIKPADLTIDEFIEQIKKTINENNIDNIDVLNLSACSDDFNIENSDDMNTDQNHTNHDQNFVNHNDHTYCTDSYINHNDHTNISDHYLDQLDHTNFTDHNMKQNDFTNFTNYNMKHHHHTNFNDHTNYTVHNMNQKDDTHLTDDNMNQTDVTHFTDYYVKHYDQNINSVDTNNANAEIFVNRIKINDGTRLNDNTKYDEDKAKSKECHKQDNNMAMNVKDSDATKQRREKYRELIKVLKGDLATDKINETSQNKLRFDCNNYQLTLYNTENESIQIPQTHKHTDSFKKQLSNNENPNNIRKRINNELCDSQSKLTKNINNDEILIEKVKSKDNSETIITEKQSNMYNTMDIVNDSCNLNLNTARHKDQVNIDILDKDINTQETILDTDTQYNTHYSQSQMNEVVVVSHFIHGNKPINVDFSKSNKELELNETKRPNDEENLNKNENYNRHTKYLGNNQIRYSETEIINSNEDDTAFQDYSLVDKQSNIENDTSLSQNTDLNIKPSTNFDAVFENCTEKNHMSVLSNDCTVFDKTSEDIDEEKIPFKVIEEVNRIKMFLRRKEYTDSGFKSQSRTFVGSQLGTPQSLWIGQSASCVFNFLCNCVLLTSTQHLTENISEVLGQLIDRLHEEELYPIFLEELLIKVDKLLQMLYEEDNYTFDVLMKKDEQIQRILLLNKSLHIQKFTIEKINNILQKLLENDTADAMEIQNINKIENLCYIFQILQNLLPKYNYNSQSSQNSQEKVLRKKDITDIWRKKWIEQKIESNEGSTEEKCVLKECSAVLNKVIIHFMEGYSLIAFSALKCFNILQS